MESRDRSAGRSRGLEPGQQREDEHDDAERAQLDHMRLLGMRKRQVQRKAARPAEGSAKIPESGGASLAGDVQARMEPQLGADLSNVKIHTGGESATAAEKLGARAFTTGTDVHFGAGEFAPGTKEGDRLIAHELTHAVQAQKSGIQRKAEPSDDGKGDGEHDVSQPGEPAEQEADAVGDHVADAIHGDKEDGGEKKAGAAGAGKQKAPAIGAKLVGVGRKVFLAREKKNGKTEKLEGNKVEKGAQDKGKDGDDKPSKKAFTPEQLALLSQINGGQELLDYLDNDDPKKGKASAPDKKRSLIEEAKVALGEIKGAPPALIAIGKEIARSSGKGTLVEIDVETPADIIQVKGGDYAKEEKLSGKDLQQLNNTKIYNEQLRGIDPTTAKKLPPKNLIWQFTKPVNPKLVSWLEGKHVVVRAPSGK